jgi:methylamine--corrinoid protein Co-methyltransferase
MSAKKHLSIFDSYDRFYNGRKVREDSWDYVIVPTNAMAMKEKYDINFSEKIIPEDDDLCDRLFYAGVEMLSTTGFYNPDMGRVLTISEDEIYEGLRRAPKSVKLGSGKEEVVCRARKGNPRIKPVVEGGPTGAPVSEEVFVPLMRSYAQESTVDVLVSGILSTINKRPSTTNTPNEIRATLAEIRNVREASVLSGRPGLGI